MPKVGGAGRLTPATISLRPPISAEISDTGFVFPTLPPSRLEDGPPLSSELTRLTHALLSQSKTKMPEVDKDFDAPYEPTVLFCLSKENP